MNDIDTEIEARLAALEARAPGRDDPPSLERHGRRSGFAASFAMAPLLVLAVVATAAAGAVVVSQLAQGTEGIENPGQPLAGARMECMTPPQAAAFLADHGFSDVVWQVEAGAFGTDGAKGTTTTTILSAAPDHGLVVPGAILDDGRLHMVVDQRVGAEGSGNCALP
jgi:hypothetical protein